MWRTFFSTLYNCFLVFVFKLIEILENPRAKVILNINLFNNNNHNIHNIGPSRHLQLNNLTRLTVKYYNLAVQLNAIHQHQLQRLTLTLQQVGMHTIQLQPGPKNQLHLQPIRMLLLVVAMIHNNKMKIN